MTQEPKPRARRTWSAFGDARRMPSEYEIVSHHTNWTLRDGRKAPLEQNVSTPANLWLTTYRDNSPLSVPDWGDYRDPDALTYRRYVAMQDDEETKVAGVLGEDVGSDSSYDEAWAGTLLALFTTTRFPLHGAQMIQTYIAQVAPSSYITNAAALSAADVLRRVSLVAYRTRELEMALPGSGFGTGERSTWMTSSQWQPARKLIEEALIAYDFGESLVAANLVILPTLDHVLLTQLAELARANSDDRTRRLLGYLKVDSDRRDRWSGEVIRYAIERQPANRPVILGWVENWAPRADAAAAALGELFERLPQRAVAAEAVVERAAASRHNLLLAAGLETVRAAT